VPRSSATARVARYRTGRVDLTLVTVFALAWVAAVVAGSLTLWLLIGLGL
jgi:hypothetical protein